MSGVPGTTAHRLRVRRPDLDTMIRIGGWLAAAILVAVVVGLAAHTSDDGRPHHLPTKHAGVGARYGLLVSSNPHDPAGSAVVRVPTGAARITVYRRTDEAYPDNDSSDDTVVGAPSGGQLFTVVVAPQALPVSATTDGVRGAAQIALVLDGTRYDLDASDRSGGPLPASRVAVGVKGHPKDVEVEVAFEGVTQTFDLIRHRRDVGRAAPLYARQAAHPGPCGTPRSDLAAAPGATAASCRIQLDLLPWTPSTGWAPSGRRWALVSALVTPPSLVRTSQGAGLQPGTDDDARVAARISGHDANAVSSVNGSYGSAPSVRYFVDPVAVDPAAPVTVTIDGTWTLEPPSALPASVDGVRVSWTTTLR